MSQPAPMGRRDFLGSAALGALSAAGGFPGKAPIARRRPETFRLNYAPHFGMFQASAGPDPIDQLRFMADQGFRAFEHNGMKGEPVEKQEKIAAEMTRLGMTMGVFVAHADFGKTTFVSADPAVREALVREMKESVEVAKRVNARWMTVVPGAFDKKLQWDYQTGNVIDNLRACAEVCEPAGVTMVLESLNPYRDHPGLFLTRIAQAWMICRAVNSPSCKILFDIYHQQITEGNLIPNIEKAWGEIAYFQIGDHPGRCEPGTGEINYRNVFRRIHALGFQGVMGMEHGNSKGGKEGEAAVIAAYREADSFE